MKVGDIALFWQRDDEFVGQTLSVTDRTALLIDPKGQYHRVLLSLAQPTPEPDVRATTDVWLEQESVRKNLRHLTRQGDSTCPGTGQFWSPPWRDVPGGDEYCFTAAVETYLDATETWKRKEERLLATMRRRAPKHHAIFVGHHYLGVKQADLCRLHGIDDGNCSRYLAIAREKMRGHWGDE